MIRTSNSLLVAAGAAGALLCMQCAAHAAGPAVSAFNGKVEASLGVIDLDDEGDFDGKLGLALSAPLGDAFGFQADLVLGTAGSDLAYGAAAHLFTRDPASYLIGGAVGFLRTDSSAIWAAGVESELYLGRVSLEAWAGVAGLDYDDSALEDLDGSFGMVTVAVYPTDNLRLSLGADMVLDYHSFRAGLEYQFDGIPLSATADIRYGEDKTLTARIGLKGYFGGDDEKSLIERHRQDDPSNKALNLWDAAGSQLYAVDETPQCPNGEFWYEGRCRVVN